MNFTFQSPFKTTLLEYFSPPSWSCLRFMLPRSCRWMLNIKPCKTTEKPTKIPDWTRSALHACLSHLCQELPSDEQSLGNKVMCGSQKAGELSRNPRQNLTLTSVGLGSQRGETLQPHRLEEKKGEKEQNFERAWTAGGGGGCSASLGEGQQRLLPREYLVTEPRATPDAAGT